MRPSTRKRAMGHCRTIGFLLATPTPVHTTPAHRALAASSGVPRLVTGCMQQHASATAGQVEIPLRGGMDPQAQRCTRNAKRNNGRRGEWLEQYAGARLNVCVQQPVVGGRPSEEQGAAACCLRACASHAVGRAGLGGLACLSSWASRWLGACLRTCQRAPFRQRGLQQRGPCMGQRQARTETGATGIAALPRPPAGGEGGRRQGSRVSCRGQQEGGGLRWLHAAPLPTPHVGTSDPPTHRRQAGERAPKMFPSLHR